MNKYGILFISLLLITLISSTTWLYLSVNKLTGLISTAIEGSTSVNQPTIDVEASVRKILDEKFEALESLYLASSTPIPSNEDSVHSEASCEEVSAAFFQQVVSALADFKPIARLDDLASEQQEQTLTQETTYESEAGYLDASQMLENAIAVGKWQDGDSEKLSRYTDKMTGEHLAKWLDAYGKAFTDGKIGFLSF